MQMKRKSQLDRRALIGTVGAISAAMAVAALPVSATAQQNYPEKPIELIIPFSPGGGVDLFGRTVARILNEEGIVEQNIQVTNLPGAGGARGMAEMAQSRRGDAYSLLGIALHVHLTPLLQGTPHSYKDMTPIAKLFSEYNMLVVRTESPIQSVEEVAEALKQDPGSLSFGGATVGNSDHITLSKFAKTLGVDPTKLTYVAYSGGESNAAILGGHVDVGLGGLDLIDLVDAGKMRVLAVNSPERLGGRYADFPTFREQGHDVLMQTWRGVFGPADMPQHAVDYWVDALTKMVQTDAWKEALEKNQWVDAFETGDEFRASMDADHEVYRSILQELGLLTQ